LTHKISGNKGLTRSRRAGCAISLGILAVLLTAHFSPATGGAPAESRTPTEYEVKAAYIYYFAKFVNWPNEAFPDGKAPLKIGVLGDDEFGSLLETIAKDKTIQEHPISIQLLKWPADLQSCHMIYVSASQLKRSRQITEELHGRPVLTVTETDTGSHAKGIMNLFMEGGKVQFEIDIAAADRAHLQISSKLLRLAHGTTNNPMARGE
jgi:hypothetical protein